MMYEVMPPAARQMIDIAKANGKKAWIATTPMIQGCPNCAGLGSLIVTTSMSGPYKYPPAVKNPIHYEEGQGWYEIRSMEFPCPVCVDKNTQVAYYWSRSGLVDEERGWHIDYLRSELGKEDAIKICGEMLSLTPAPKGWLLLFGDFGRGKSGLLKSMVASFIKAGVEAQYMTASDILAKIRATYNQEATVTETEIREVLGSAKFLAIDEVDRVGDTPWAKSTMAAILDYRHRVRGLYATAFATNADPTSLPGMEYLASRLKDARRAFVGGRDMRGER